MEQYNPWWQNEIDYTYEEWESKQYKWIPYILPQITLEPFALHMLTGPRQVGKTTLLKILIQKVIKKNRNPRSIFYYQCDELIDFRELGEILDLYLSDIKRRNISHPIIILDEITFVHEWWRALKARIDQGILKNSVVIISGSASMELLKTKEHFPGRRGVGQDFILFPIDFNQYLQLFKVDLKPKSIETLIKMDDFIAPAKIFEKTLQEAFQSYLNTGGFPRSINDYLSNGKVKTETTRTYLDWIRGDVLRIGLKEEV